MASRISKSSIDWVKFGQMVSKRDRPMFNAFKSKSDGYLRRVLSYPEKPPAINWQDFKAKVASPELVDQLEKSYNSLQITYPKDTRSLEVDEQEKQDQKDAEEFCKFSQLKVEEATKLLHKFEVMIPYDHMLLEDFTLTFPNWSVTWHEETIFPFEDKQPGLSKEEREEIQKPDGPPYSVPPWP